MFLPKISCLITTIPHMNYWDQLNSGKNFWKFWNGPLYRNKSGPSPLLNVAVYWKSSNTKACANRLSQILTNNIDNRGRGIGLRIYVRYCSFQFLITEYQLRLPNITPYSILQYIGKVATPKLVQRNCLRFLVPFLWGGIFDKRSTLFVILCQWVPYNKCKVVLAVLTKHLC